jgi:hypothetical protein
MTIAWQKFFWSTWKSFGTRFKAILDGLKRHKDLIESEASLKEIEAAREAREAAETRFAEREKHDTRQKHMATAAWLAGASSRLDQEEAEAVRAEYPQSGRWLLERPPVKAWRDVSVASKPLLWIRGIPGAGTSSNLYY